MLSIDIICAGRVKEKHYQDACAEYIKRLTPYAKVTVIEQPEGKPLVIPDGRAHTVALCVDGRALSSGAFSDELQQLADNGQPRLRFLIGGSDGLFPEDVARADDRLSLSAMTLTHAMARVVLLEQVYRACMIGAGQKYHK